MVAWRHMGKRARYSDDCIYSVSNYHAEFSTCSLSLLMAASRTDEDKADESEVADIDSRYLSDVDVCCNSISSCASEGSESDLDEICNVVEEEANNLGGFFRDAVLRLVEINATVFCYSSKCPLLV